MALRAIRGDLYDYPRYYDLVFGSDWSAEFKFLEACFTRHVTGRARRLFEPACGTGRLLYRLAKAGYEVSGLDLNEKAVAFCNERLRRHGLPATAVVADMTDFRLSRRVDAAFNTINSFRHLSSESAARAHLECVAAAARKGGVYALGLHLTPTVGEPLEEEAWSARRGSLCVNTRLWTTHRDTRKRQERFSMTYDVYTPTDSFRIKDSLEFRTYTAAQMRRLIDSVGDLQIAETYDFSYDIDQPIRVAATTEDVVYVLRKK